LDHQQASELFSAYRDKELDAAKAKELEDHLQACVVCRRDWQQFERTVSVLGGLERASAPPDFARGVVERVRQRSKGRFFAPRRAIDRVPYELFSLVMLAIILVIYLVMQYTQPGRVNIP
jgi:anti-sigma factor RsiW